MDTLARTYHGRERRKGGGEERRVESEAAAWRRRGAQTREGEWVYQKEMVLVVVWWEGREEKKG
jgi:hypothetical protein